MDLLLINPSERMIILCFYSGKARFGKAAYSMLQQSKINVSKKVFTGKL